ncbi:MAG: hypothetical protein LQ340_006551, partial [Diploschistes diacapsis]
MKAYYYDDVEGDPRLPHTTQPDLPLSHLSALGVLTAHFPTSSPSSPDGVNALARQRSYSHRDEITVSPQAMGSVYEDKIKMFFDEHMHEDEEIRYILGGAGYFDVREKGDSRWVRIRCEEGDLLVLPPGIYHRFTVDGGDYIRAMRLFKDEPKWTPLNRGEQTEANDLRKHLQRFMPVPRAPLAHARPRALSRPDPSPEAAMSPQASVGEQTQKLDRRDRSPKSAIRIHGSADNAPGKPSCELCPKHDGERSMHRSLTHLITHLAHNGPPLLPFRTQDLGSATHAVGPAKRAAEPTPRT